MKINPNGFREYDARWLFEKDIDIEGINNLGKGLGTQIINHLKNKKSVDLFLFLRLTIQVLPA